MGYTFAHPTPNYLLFIQKYRLFGDRQDLLKMHGLKGGQRSVSDMSTSSMCLPIRKYRVKLRIRLVTVLPNEAKALMCLMLQTIAPKFQYPQLCNWNYISA